MQDAGRKVQGAGGRVQDQETTPRLRRLEIQRSDARAVAQAHSDLARRHIRWEVCTAYFGVLDRRTFHVQMPQIATPQIRISQIGISDDQMAQVDPSEIDASQVAATKINDLTAFDTLVKPIHISDSQGLVRQVLRHAWLTHSCTLCVTSVGFALQM